jgi:hypothetical protein
MPVVAVYALAFNVLLWTARFALESWLPGHSTLFRWGVILIAPVALMLAAYRAMGTKRSAIIVVTVISLVILGLVA